MPDSVVDPTDADPTDADPTDADPTDTDLTDAVSREEVSPEAASTRSTPLRPDQVVAPADQVDSGAVDSGAVDSGPSSGPGGEVIDHPAKVMRLGTMLKLLLDEVRETSLDEGSRNRLKSIYETSITELASALSPDLSAELDRLTSPFTEDDIPSAAELRIAKAQLVGWLEGLVQGIQATLFAQQMMAQQQLAQMQQAQLGQGQAEGRPGTYL